MQNYIPLPPLAETVKEFFHKGLASPLVMTADGDITIPGHSPFIERAIQCGMGAWAQASGMAVDVKRNAFNSWIATIGKPIVDLHGNLIGAKPLCSFTHEREGEALFRAVLLYEEKLANGDFNNNANDNKGGLLDEFGKPIRASDEERLLGQQASGAMVSEVGANSILQGGAVAGSGEEGDLTSQRLGRDY